MILGKNKYFLNPYDNDMFSEFRGLDLLGLIKNIENTTLIYRDSLNLPYDITFGVEIEYENLKKEIVDKYVSKNLKDWKSKTDRSVVEGGEVVSPILTDTKTTWENLKKICDFLKKRSLIYEDTTGGHVHVSENTLANDVDSWRLLLKTYAIYENILFRFGYNDRIKGREEITDYAEDISKRIYKFLPKLDKNNWIYNFTEEFGIDKYLSLNLRRVKFYDNEVNKKGNTLEFRFPNATFEEVIWQNNVNTFTKMMLSSKNKTIDEDFLNYKLKNNEIAFKYGLCSYSEVDLRNALEFVDLVFDNNLDKIYFLRQYLKNFSSSYNLESVNNVKVKRFVK